jgi:hypothetical protein
MGGIPNYVQALTVFGTNLIAAGSFTSAGGISANRIAQWDGASWSPLGSGMNGDVLALTSAGNTLYAGGLFTIAGYKACGYLAEASLASAVAAPVIIATNSSFGFTNRQFGFDVNAQPGSTLIIQASTNLVNWIPLQTSVVGASPVYFADPFATNYPWRFYRAAAHP